MNRLLFAAFLLLLISPLSAFAGTTTRFFEVTTGTFNDAALTGFRIFCHAC